MQEVLQLEAVEAGADDSISRKRLVPGEGVGQEFQVQRSFERAICCMQLLKSTTGVITFNWGTLNMDDEPLISL